MTPVEIKILRAVLGMCHTTRIPVQNGWSAQLLKRYPQEVPKLIEQGLLEQNPSGGKKEYTATKLGIHRVIDEPWD